MEKKGKKVLKRYVKVSVIEFFFIKYDCKDEYAQNVPWNENDIFIQAKPSDYLRGM